MMNKIVILLACLSLAFQVSSCTSKESQSDSEVAADVDSADLEKLEGDESLQAAGDNNLSSDQLPEDALGETPAPTEQTSTTETTTTTTEQTIGDDVATTQQTDVATNTETLPADPLAPTNDIPTPPTETSLDTPSTDTVAMSETTKTTEHTTTIVENPEPVKQVSLQKVATTPWKVGKKWFNTVYFARPGDTLSGISQMIYGANKVSELKKGNPTLKSRSVKPGDKVYYNSPNRPDDSAKMMTYYEDNGMSPEVYVAKSGDNIRKVSKTLLGYSNAWKEIWASNSVDSKGDLPEGTELRFWKGGAVAAAPVKQPRSEVAPATPAPTEPEIPAMPTEEPPMPPQQQAQADIPPPPPMPEQPPAEMAPPPPPPPPQDMAQEMTPPPPPPPPVEAVNPPAPKPEVAEEVAPEGMDQDTTLALAVVGLAAAGLAALIVVRKKRKQRELEMQAMDSTHVHNI